jgi:hypothetical protein
MEHHGIACTYRGRLQVRRVIGRRTTAVADAPTSTSSHHGRRQRFTGIGGVRGRWLGRWRRPARPTFGRDFPHLTVGIAIRIGARMRTPIGSVCSHNAAHWNHTGVLGTSKITSDPDQHTHPHKSNPTTNDITTTTAKIPCKLKTRSKKTNQTIKNRNDKANKHGHTCYTYP